MTGRPGYRTMETIGGSSAPYLARTPCIPLVLYFVLIGLETKNVLDYQGRAGDHARYCDTIAAIPHIARYFLREVSSPPKWCDTPPFVPSLAQAHLRDTPFCSVSRDNCAYRAIIVRYPIQKNQHKRVFAILSLQGSRDMKSIAAWPLSPRPGGWQIFVNVFWGHSSWGCDPSFPLEKIKLPPPRKSRKITQKLQFGPPRDCPENCPQNSKNLPTLVIF